MLLDRIKKITLASLCTLLLYLLSYVILGAIATSGSVAKTVVWTILAIALPAVFSYLLIYFYYLRKRNGEFLYWKDFREGVLDTENAWKNLLSREKGMILLFFSMNFLFWVIGSIDMLLFDKQTFSMVLIIYSPMNMIVEILPNWAYGILGYLGGAVITSFWYLLEMFVVQKKWKKQIVEQERSEEKKVGPDQR